MRCSFEIATAIDARLKDLQDAISPMPHAFVHAEQAVEADIKGGAAE